MTYRRIKRLGAGYFGEVWLEQDNGLDRLCAAKYLDSNKILTPCNPFAEAQAMNLPEHENVVGVYSADHVGPTPVIRMEYLRSGSVEDRYAKEPIIIGDAIRIIEDMCRGLEHLHVNGLLHRDIKPGNLLIADAGQVKVSDFGLAGKHSNTATLVPAAYRLHLPPESASIPAGITTKLGDVYATGVTAYRLVNGDDMLHSSMPADLEAGIASGAFPDRNLWQLHVHKKLRRAICRAMHPDPSKRFDGAAAFRRAVEQARPTVSWEVTDAQCRNWAGSDSTGAEWHASISAGPAANHTFSIARRLPGKE